MNIFCADTLGGLTFPASAMQLLLRLLQAREVQAMIGLCIKMRQLQGARCNAGHFKS